MAIVNRIRRLFQADVHAILDAVEEPEAILKQAIREMQESLDLKQGGLARSERILAALKLQESDLQEQLETAQRNLELSLREGSEELVRKSIARRLALEKQKRILRRRIEELDSTCSNLTEEIEAQTAELDSILQRAKTLAPISDAEDALAVADSILASQESGHLGILFSPSTRVTEEEIELEMIRLQQENQGGES